jgi:hypothetical protein
MEKTIDSIKLEVSKHNNWYDFTDGVDISETQITLWLRECIDSIKKKIDTYPKQKDYFSTISSGNTKVLVECYRNGTENTFTLYCSVIKSHKQGSLTSVKFD